MSLEIKNHLNNDPVLKVLIEKYPLTPLTESPNLFLALVETIVSQQLSIKASDTIFNRLLALTSKSRDQVTTTDIFNLTHDKLRSAGLSNSKANYIHLLSASIIHKNLDLNSLHHLSDEDVKTELVKLKGIGPWSAEMFLIFSLNRPDVFSIGDLGLRTAVSKLYDLNRDDHESILKLSKTWSPFRSFASRLLWKSLNNS